MSDAMRSAVLNGLPDRFLSVTLAGVNRDVEIFALNVVKGVHMLFGRIAAFFAGQVEADHAALAKIHGQFRHLQRDVHVAHGADDQSGRYSKILAPPLQSLQHGGNYLLVGQSLAGMKNRRKAGFKVNHAILAQVFGLFVGDALQRLFGLHDRDGVREALQIFGEAALVRALMKPLGQRRRIAGGKLRVFCELCQINDGLRPQHAIEVFMQKNFWQAPQ